MHGEDSHPEEAPLEANVAASRARVGRDARVDLPSGNAPLATAGLQRFCATPGGAVLPVVPMRGD